MDEVRASTLPTVEALRTASASLSSLSLPSVSLGTDLPALPPIANLPSLPSIAELPALPSELLPLLDSAVPFELHEQATHVLFNATSIKEPALLSVAAREGTIEAMITAAAIAHAQQAIEGLTLAYGTLCNVAEGCAEGRRRE